MANDTKPRPAPTATMAFMSERVSEKGRTYFIGWGGHCKFLLFKTDKLDKFDNPVWTLNVQQCEPKLGTLYKAPNGEPPAQHLPAPSPEREPSGHGEDPNDDIPF